MPAFDQHLVCAPMVTPQEVLDCCPAAVDAGLTVTSPELLDAVEDASTVAYYLTGRQFHGTCTETVRPCIQCGCGSKDCCCTPEQVDLGLWPITNIVSVWFEGAAQPVTDFHVDEWRYIVSFDPEFRFPRCNNMNEVAGGPTDNRDDGFVFEIEVEYGMTVPRMMTRAARALACELIGDCANATCDLPDLVTSVNRRGITQELANPLDLLRDGRTGVYAMDLAIATFNPSKLQSPTFVWSPDTGNRGRNKFT